MTLHEIEDHFEYGRWANDRMLQAVAALTHEQLERQLGSSFPTIRDTVAHVAGAEWIWLRRWLGDSPSSFPEWTKTASLAELTTTFSDIARERSAFLHTLTDADIAKPIAFKLLNGQADTQRLEGQLLHVVNHSTYHRGQIAGMIRQVGGTPISTDLIAYRRQVAARA